MTGRIGKITAPPEKKRAKNGDADVLMLTVHFSDGGTTSVQWMSGAGDDTSPQENDIVAVERFGGVLAAVASMSPGGPARKSGEREFYSRTSAGDRDSRIILGGKVYIGNRLTNLCTVMLGLIDKIKALTVTGQAAVDPAWAPALEAYKAEIQKILEDQP
jgi:hypothetical protein